MPVLSVSSPMSSLDRMNTLCPDLPSTRNIGGKFMPDLREGEVITVPGSSSRSYEIKNYAGIYFCSCPAWRNQSLPIDQRTCKHLRAYRGGDVEQARIGTILSPRPINGVIKAPPLLLAESWD